MRPEQVSKDDFTAYIQSAADALSAFDYEIASTQHQLTKTRYWAMINSTSDPLTQLATTHTPDEIAFIQRMIQAMFETYNTKRRNVMAVSAMQALKKEIIKPGRESMGNGELAADRGLTQQQAEACLAVLVSEGWFELSRESYYSLTPRALMELGNWLVEMFNDPDDEEDGERIRRCDACKDIITTGQRCGTVECPFRLHDVCQRAYWNSRPDKTCPHCETEWVEDKNFVGQRVITKTEDYLREKRKSGGGGGAAKNHRTPVEEEDTDEDAEGELEDDVSSSPPRVNGRDKRENRVEETEDNQEEEEEEEEEEEQDTDE